jgi:SOS regulatory protein LexA
MRETVRLTLGDIIAKYRKEHGISMDEFAKQSGISKGYISMLERNKTHRGDEPSPSVDMYKSVAKVINVDLDELIRLVDGNITLNTSPLTSIPGVIPYVRGRRLPIIGAIPAGVPVLATENIEGYDYADVPESEDYFFLRVKGDSMINAKIYDGDLVLIKMQPCADDGQIVACIVNGEEATLKRFRCQGDIVLLQPENSDYSPIIVPCKDFESGYARIVGVATEVKHKL